jgi:ParB-like chromosome segregation protein Spo0J
MRVWMSRWRKSGEVQTMKAAATWEDISSLTPWGKNPRHNAAAIEQVRKSIERFGFSSPIIARQQDRVIIAGHTRHQAALKMGLDKVPVRFLDLDPAQARALALADNRLGEVAEWDDGMLAEVLAELEAESVDLDGLGWSDEEMKMIIAGAESVGDDEWGDALGALPEGDRTMTFTLHDDQVEQVKAAMTQAKSMGDYGDTGNENGNGNALSRICETFLTLAAPHG